MTGVFSILSREQADRARHSQSSWAKVQGSELAAARHEIVKP